MSDCTGCWITQVLLKLTGILCDHKFLLDVTGCQKTQVSDCTSSTVYLKWSQYRIISTYMFHYYKGNKLYMYFTYYFHALFNAFLDANFCVIKVTKNIPNNTSAMK